MPKRLKVPSFPLDEPDDYYVYYVLVLGIPEDVFWHSDWAFVTSVAERKGAYDAWLAGERENMLRKG